jgi:hypothetical protein
VAISGVVVELEFELVEDGNELFEVEFVLVEDGNELFEVEFELFEDGNELFEVEFELVELLFEDEFGLVFDDDGFSIFSKSFGICE